MGCPRRNPQHFIRRRGSGVIAYNGQTGDVHTYIRLKELLAGLQAELDTSWAVLGELYGRYARLRDLVIDIRRVRSNLDDVTAFSQTVDYIPAKCSFQAAGPELLRLLIGPLYANNPHIGIRELVQNAVDACIERDDIIKRLPALSKQFGGLAADVVVSLDEDANEGWTLTIQDRGVGMSTQTVRDYFLRAGATFRNSDSWKEQHTVAGKGKYSRVARSGRFGIGVLAAFLLSEQIYVETQYLLCGTNDQGVQFEGSIDIEELQLRKASLPTGTTIRLRLPERVSKLLLKDFREEGASLKTLPHGVYLPSYPRVKVFLNGSEVKRLVLWPNERAELPFGWHRLRIPNFSDVQWSYSSSAYSDRYSIFSGQFALNGLYVCEVPSSPAWDLKHGLHIRPPNVSVFDRNCKLGLTLDRNRLIEV
jgi:molecular chaperone HtpG